jgi:hypothetical protein
MRKWDEGSRYTLLKAQNAPLGQTIETLGSML